MTTLCTYYPQCTNAEKCGKKVEQEQLERLLVAGEPIMLFVAPPVCHTSWKDRQDLYKEGVE